jgi:hypothetical protein
VGGNLVGTPLSGPTFAATGLPNGQFGFNQLQPAGVCEREPGGDSPGVVLPVKQLALLVDSFASFYILRQ